MSSKARRPGYSLCRRALGELSARLLACWLLCALLLVPLVNAPARHAASRDAAVSHLDLIDDTWASKLDDTLRALY
jgi:hypothetical protein